MSRPAVFTELSFADAVARAKDDKKLLIVDATAEWCGPCKAMDRGAWVDSSVVEWIRANALAIQFDVDAQEALAKQLEIRAMPTLVAVRDGAVVDRLVGLQNPHELLGWLQDLDAGVTSLQRARGRVTSGQASVSDRHGLARQLVTNGKLDEALTELEWLWSHCLEVEPAYAGVRASYLANDIKELAASFPPAKARFTALRDECRARVFAPVLDGSSLNDWSVLNEIVGDESATVGWYDHAKATFPLEALRADRYVSHVMIPRLIEAGRWSEVGLLVADAAAAFESAKSSFEALRDAPVPPEHRESIVKYCAEKFEAESATIRACFLAAGRRDEAEKLAAAARAYRPSESLEAAIAEWEKKTTAPVP